VTAPAAISRAANNVVVPWRMQSRVCRSGMPGRIGKTGPVRSSLDLGLLAHADHDRVPGRLQVQAHHVADLGFQQRAGGELQALRPVRPQTEFPPQPGDAVMADRDRPRPAQQSARRRDDQCVTPRACNDSGGGTAAARISHTTSSVSTVFGPPGREASSSPASPASAYWRRHLTTVGSVQPARSAIRAPVSPSAASSTMRARPTTRAGAPFDRARRSARPGHHRAPSAPAPDSASAIVPRFRRNIKRDTRQTTSPSRCRTSWPPPRRSPPRCWPT
jgi:hypothetical protein